MSRLLILSSPLLQILAPGSLLALKARWALAARDLARATEQKRFDGIDELLDQGRRLADALAPHDPDVAAKFNLLGDCYHNVAGRNRDAESAYRKALEIAEALPDDRVNAVASSLNNLALLLLRQSRADEAETLLRRLLGLLEGTHGRESPEYATGLENLSAALRQQGRNEEAASARGEVARLRSQ